MNEIKHSGLDLSGKILIKGSLILNLIIYYLNIGFNLKMISILYIESWNN